MRRRLLGVLARVGVMLLATELTLRAVLLVDAVAVPLSQSTPWNGAARMFWTDRRLKSLVTRSPRLTWEEVGPEEDWDPDLGWSRRPGRPETDAHGCRDGGLPRDAGAHRIALVGDSYTFGTEVPVTDSYGHLLELHRPDVDVHNLAMPAYDHVQAMLRWERDGVPLAPEAVVLLGIGVDAARSMFWFYGYAKPWPEVDAAGAVRVLGQPVDRPAVAFAKGLAHPRLLDLVDVVRERRAAGRDLQARLDEADRRVVAVLDRWVASVRATGAVPMVFSVPTPQELDMWRTDPQTMWIVRSRGLYERWCADRDFPCEDLWDELIARVDNDEAYRAGVHFSRATNEAIAALVEARLVSAGVIPVR